MSLKIKQEEKKLQRVHLLNGSIYGRLTHPAQVAFLISSKPPKEALQCLQECDRGALVHPTRTHVQIDTKANELV